MLPLPSLSSRRLNGIPFITDDALASSVGVRIGFSGRVGGVSKPPYDSLNLGSHVGDDRADVDENRRLLLQAVGASSARMLTLNQVHGTDVACVNSLDEDAFAQVQAQAEAGADAAVVTVSGVAPILCFADCTPVIMVEPQGGFALAHAGWRGAVGGVVSAAALRLCQQTGCQPQDINLYVGPHLREECFEVGPEVVQAFAEAYGSDCVADERHVSLSRAVFLDAMKVGLDPQRMVDAGVCTRCNQDDFFSYRGSGGVCGRHGAFAVRC